MSIAFRELPSAARRLRGIVVAVAREVHHVVLLERGEQRETPHALSAEERHVDAGKGVEQAAEVLGLRAGLRKRLRGIGHEKDAQALPARGRLLRNPTRRDHLAPDTELRRQEVAAVVAQLPGNVHESLVETQVEVAGRRLAQQRARRLGQEVREDEPAHALQRTRRRRPAAAGRGGEVRRLAGEVTQEVVVDVRLAAREQRSPLGEIDEVAITLAEDGEMDRSARPVRHGTGGRSSRTPRPVQSASFAPRIHGRRSSRKLVPIPGQETSYTPGFMRGIVRAPVGVGACRVDGATVPPEEDPLPAERILLVPEEREREADRIALGEDRRADLGLGRPDPEAERSRGLACADRGRRRQLVDGDHGRDDVALEQRHAGAGDPEHERGERFLGRCGGPARCDAARERGRNGQPRLRVQPRHPARHLARMPETGGTGLEMEIDRSEVIGGQRAGDPSRQPIGLDAAGIRWRIGRARIDRHRGTRGRRRPLQAVQATAACGAAVDVDPDRFHLCGRELSVEELRQEHRIGAGHGAVSWAGFIRRSSRSRRRKIREQTVPTVEFRRRAMSL